MQKKNWPVNTYPNSVWQNLVEDNGVVACVIITNNSFSETVNVQMRLVDTTESPPAQLAMLLPTLPLAPGAVFTYDVRAITVTADQALQVRADGQGVSFFGCGSED